ncbi:MAG: sugar phosphate isomerase/epimerase family protein [Planctomycetota bacterium]
MIGRLGVCSWSLQADSPSELVERVSACGLDAVQLALRPIRTDAWDLAETSKRLADAGIAILSGMMEPIGEDYTTLESIKRTGGLRPSEHWQVNLELAQRDAVIAESLGLSLVTYHAGFLPHEPSDPERETMLDRIRQVADVFARHGVRTALETGQEDADTLITVLRAIDHPGVGVNFDPANMVLYGMGDPIEALRALSPWVVQAHLKDADPTTETGTWGVERPAGVGSVPMDRYFELLGAMEVRVDVLIERESGSQRVADVAAARSIFDGLGAA